MKRKRLIIFFSIALGLALIAFVTRQFYGPHEYTVWVRPDGFYPKKLVIAPGSTVVFRADGVTAFWPASNFHPSHRLYVEFDAKAVQTLSWNMVFARSGVWRYHDHINSRKTGMIVVRSWPWQKDMCGRPEVLPRDSRQVCAIQRIERALDTKGLDAAFEEFARMYEKDQQFAPDCHDITHLLGESAYREYAKHQTIVTSSKTSYCGYGFYHGFIEALLFTTGKFDAAKSYCRAVHREVSKTIASPNVIYACYHGIGHGAFDTQSAENWGHDGGMVRDAIAVCDQVTKGEDAILVKQCASGVFNGLANAYGNATYQLSFPSPNPLAICERQERPDFRRACVLEVGVAYLVSMEEFKTQVHFIAGLKRPEDREAITYGFFADAARRAGRDFDGNAFEEMCLQLPAALRGTCIRAGAAGLFLWGAPGQEHVRALEYCGSTPGQFKDACFGEILPKLISLYEASKVKSICESVDRAWQRYCL